MLTLTPLDPTVSPHTVYPDTDPTTGVVTFTGRPSRAQRHKATFHALLSGFGVDPVVAGAGTASEDEDVRQITARLRSYDVKAIVVRHATNISLESLDALRRLARNERIHLALTCDNTVGEDVAEWVDQNNGTIHQEPAELDTILEQFTRRPVQLDPTPDVEPFPLHLPECGWFTWRTRAQELLDPDDYERVDALYVEAARDVHDNPFTTPEDAARRLQDWYQRHPYPGEMLTVVRAAQAAMFKHGMSLKVDEDRLMCTVEHHHFRRLTAHELRTLRAYFMSWRSANRALHDTDLSLFDVFRLKVGDVNPDGSINGVAMHPEAQQLLATQWHYRQLEDAKPTDRFLNRGVAYLRTAVRHASIDLNLPAMPTFDERNKSTSHRWQDAVGISLRPLTGCNNLNERPHLLRPTDPEEAAS